MNKNKKPRREPAPISTRTVSSAVLDRGRHLEMIFDPSTQKTSFVEWHNGRWQIVPDFKPDSGRKLVPFSAGNNLIRHAVVLFPSKPEEYGSQAELLSEIQRFIHRYVDVSERFERIAAYYVLLTWVYDAFNELPYLRLRGDYGSGKTRFLLTVGSLCYTPIFTSGASTVSPLFHTLDAFRGTLIIDEADFRFSDEKAEIVKILNNGNIRGLPVLRSEATPSGEYNPRAFAVFGPKLVASRGTYDDRALESRFITENTGQNRLRTDIPFNLPSSYKDEARALRNKLLLFRLRMVDRMPQVLESVDDTIEPRLNQIFAPLLCVVDEEECREELRNLARSYHSGLIADRGLDMEAQVLQVIRHLFAYTSKTFVPLKEITECFVEHFGAEFEQKITSRWIGGILRRKLRLDTHKSMGIYVLPLTERAKLELLYERYGINSDDLPNERDHADQLKLVFESRDLRDKREEGSAEGIAA